MARPSPVPSKRLVADPSACTKASKMSRSLSAGMPIPVSLTAKCRATSSGLRESCATLTSTSP